MARPARQKHARAEAGAAEQKPALPNHIAKQLTPGEIIFWSGAKQYSTRGRAGKWVAEIRRRQADGSQRDYPVRGFDLPQDALAYVKSTRGETAEPASRQRFTVADLFEEWRRHGWKGNHKVTRDQKERRWKLHIEPRWGHYRVSEVKRREAQIWFTELEEQVARGEVTFGVPTIRELKNDLHGLFEFGILQEFTDRANPFKGISLTPPESRKVLVIESSSWSDIWWALDRLAEPYGDANHSYANQQLVNMFKLSLLTGLRKGELLALEWSRVNLEQNLVKVHRALRDHAQEIDEQTGRPSGPVLRYAVHFPKGDKLRDVPLSNQAKAILEQLNAERRSVPSTGRDFVFPAPTGGLLTEQTHDRRWQNLRKNLAVLAKGERVRWHRLNVIMTEMKALGIALPTYWEALGWRDLRASFASYMREVRIPEGEARVYLGHGPRSVTDAHYERVTAAAFAAAVETLTEGWSPRG